MVGLAALLLACFGAREAAAAVGQNDYPYANSPADQVDRWNFYTRECTSFAAWRLNNDGRIAFNNYYKGVHWGNANNWANAARSAGIPVDASPRAGDIAIFPPNTNGAGSVGHVAYVMSVGNGTVQIEDYNWKPYAYYQHSVRSSGLSFIHFGGGIDRHIHHVYGTGGAGLYLRSGPGTSYSQRALMPEGQQVYVVCQVRSNSSVHGSTIWDNLSAPAEGWASDYYIDTENFNDFSPGLPQCPTQRPTTTIDVRPSDPSNSSAATFGFSASDPTSSYECSLDSAAFAGCSAPKSYTGLSDGTHTFSVRASDWAGTSDPATYGWTIDTQAPDTKASGPGSHPRKPVFKLSSHDPTVHFECALDDAEFTVCTSPVSYTVSGGRHVFQARAVDGSGNADLSPAVVKWKA